MGLFHKKAENVAAKEPEKKEELSPFEAAEQQIVDLYSDFDDEQLFTINLVFEHGTEYDLLHQNKENVGWIVAHKNKGSKGIFQYSEGKALGIGIDLRKVIMLTVKPEEVSKNKEDAA